VKQLVLDLGIQVVAAAPIQLTPELEERLVALMADALRAAVEDVPKPKAGAQPRGRIDDE
jgi:hypothetical protein